jgi:ribosomal protein S18 acetylase RimI-like enzyme
MISIRSATADDAAMLATLAERTFRETYAPDNTAADVDAYVAQHFALPHQLAELRDPRMTTLLAEDARGVAIAYAQLHEGDAPPSVQLLPSIEIGRFYVDRPHHGRGVAKQLMEAVLAAAADRRAASVWLAVWERNERAQAFYRKLRFEQVGTMPFLLGSDLQNDLVLTRRVELPL